ncbi:toll-like receptor 2 [Lineus longissimus]|uniref:toll-like receptor 2 n=1 Tax=Lineus longissimus TaxID=88925 RepID=UPI00315CAA60
MRLLLLTLLVLACAIFVRVESKPSRTTIYPGCQLEKHLHHHDKDHHPPECVWLFTCKWIMGNEFATVATKMVERTKESPVTEFHIEQCLLPNADDNEIDLSVAQNLGNLEGLKIKNCKVIGIKSDTFDSIVNLRWLSLHNASIAYLPTDVFTKLSKLETLKLPRNILRNLTLEISSRNLTKIELHASSLNILQITPTVGTLQLTTINVKDNNLTRIGGLSDLIGNDASIQIDGNPFDLSSKPFGLKELNLSHLSVSIWNEEDIGKLSDAIGHFRSIDTLSVVNESLSDNCNFTFQKLENMTIKTLEVLRFSNWWGQVIDKYQLNPYTALKNIQELRLRDCNRPRYNVTRHNDREIFFPSSSMTSLNAVSVNHADLVSLRLSYPNWTTMLDLSHGVSSAISHNHTDDSKIRSLNLSCTSIEIKLVLTGTSSIEELILRNITLTDHVMKPNNTIWLAPLPRLRHLDLSSNSNNYYPYGPFFTWLFNVSDAFIGLGNLERLELNYTDIGEIDTGDLMCVFHPLRNLKRLDLDKSRFSYIPKKTFVNQVHLEELYLAENGIRAIENSVFRALVRLKHLDLRNNKIGYISGETMALLTSLPQGTFRFTGNNLWCNCDLAEFTWWLKKTAFRPDKQCEMSNEKCVGPSSLIDTSILDYQPPWLDCDNNLLILTVSSAFSFFLTLSTSVAIHAYRRRLSIRYWYVVQKMRRARSHQSMNTEYGAPDNDPDDPFDVFVSFEYNDRFWVTDTLLPKLENSDDIRFRVCTVDRDLNDPGRPEVMNVARGIRNSRNVIFVVTRELIQTAWCEYEMSLAETQSLQEGNCRLIIIFLEKFTWEELPLCLKRLLSHVNFLRWPETTHEQKDFWCRLRLVILGEEMQSTTRVVYTQY